MVIGIINTQNSQCQTIKIPAQKELLRITNSIDKLEVTANNEIIAGTPTGVYVFNSSLQLVAKLEAGYKPEDIGTKRFLFCFNINVFNNGDALAITTKGAQFYDHQKKIFFPLTEHPNPYYRQLGSHLAQHHLIIFPVLTGIIIFFVLIIDDTANQLFVFDLNSGKTISSPLPFTKEIYYATQFSFHNDSLFSINAASGGFYLFSYNSDYISGKH